MFMIYLHIPLTKLLTNSTLILAVAAFGFILSRLIFSFLCTRYVLNHQAFQDAKLHVNYTFMKFVRFHLWNFLVTILTVGLASPYVTYRQLKFIQKYYSLEGNAEALLTHQNTDETTGQDGASGLLDLSDF